MCGPNQADLDLRGADIPAGTVSDVDSVDACCTACLARLDCGAYTYVPWGRVCYLKSAAGFTNATTPGMQSALIAGRQPAVVIVDPTPPPTTPTPEVPGGEGGGNGTGDPYAPGPYKFVDMTPDQKRRMYQLTSIFENSNVRRGRGGVLLAREGRAGGGLGAGWGWAARACARSPPAHCRCASTSVVPPSSSPALLPCYATQTDLQYGYADRLGDDRG